MLTIKLNTHRVVTKEELHDALKWTEAYEKSIEVEYLPDGVVIRFPDEVTETELVLAAQVKAVEIVQRDYSKNVPGEAEKNEPVTEDAK